MPEQRKCSVQVTCRCCVYAFPHRIGGGRCWGDRWAESYYALERECCQTCVENTGDACAVADGRESYVECAGYQEHLHQQPAIRHPYTEAEWVELRIASVEQYEES